MTKETLLDVLPPYRDEWLMINKRQEVRDIIQEILVAHNEFSSYYDTIAPYFYTGDLRTTCTKIYNFLRENVTYNEESDQVQTSALPSGIFTRGFGDCKHYALVAAGILDAIARSHPGLVNWCFCFASYKLDEKVPYHVFVVCEMSDGSTVWVDPTPGAEGMVPIWVICKRSDGTDCNYMVTGQTGKIGGCGCDKVGTPVGMSESGEVLALLLIAGLAALLLL